MTKRSIITSVFPQLFSIFIICCGLFSCIPLGQENTPPPITPRDTYLGAMPNLNEVSDLACSDGNVGRFFKWLNKAEEGLINRFGEHYSMSEQADIARQFHGAVRRNFKIIEDERSENLRRILADLVAVIERDVNTPQPDYEIFLIRSREDGTYMNAFTPCGGNIYFSEFLYEFCRNDAERAFIVGHELGHNLLEHSKQGFQRESILKNTVGVDWSEPLGIVWDLLTIPLDATDETAADLSSVHLCQHAGYDPDFGRSLYYRMEQYQPSDRSMIRYASTHVHFDTRRACIANYLTECEERINAISER